MIKVWVMFVYLSSGPFASWSYDTEKECLRDADNYKNAVCVGVSLPRKQ